MNPDELLERARSQLGLGTRYRLGGGKIVPYGRDCRDEGASADCSSFVCWVLGFRKFQDRELWWLHELNGGWLNTDGIWCDAYERTGHFIRIIRPERGCVIVYPASWVSSGNGRKIGHVGIVTQVRRSHPLPPSIETISVIHCSSGATRKKGDAIQEEPDPNVFKTPTTTIYAWPSSVEPEQELMYAADDKRPEVLL